MQTDSPTSRYLIVMAAFVIIVAGMRAAEPLITPFVLSLFIAVLCSPPLVWMKSKGIPNGVAILIIMAVVVISSVLVGAIVGSAITGFKQDLPSYQERLTGHTRDLFLFIQSMGIDLDLERLKGSFDPSSALGFAGRTLASFGNMMTNAFMILLTVVFILTEEVGFSDKLKLVSSNSEKSLEALSRFTNSVNRYMAIKTGLSLLTGLFVFFWLWIQGVDYFVLWGTLAFLLNFIPTLGSILAAIPAVLLSLVQLGPLHALITMVGFVFVNVGVGNVLEPRMMGKGLDLSALVVFLSLVFWGWVLGPVGMLLSVPLTMTVKIALESFEDTQWIAVMLGSGKSAEAKLT